jgi:hypothetical protein
MGALLSLFWKTKQQLQSTAFLRRPILLHGNKKINKTLFAFWLGKMNEWISIQFEEYWENQKEITTIRSWPGRDYNTMSLGKTKLLFKHHPSCTLENSQKKMFQKTWFSKNLKQQKFILFIWKALQRRKMWNQWQNFKTFNVLICENWKWK